MFLMASLWSSAMAASVSEDNSGQQADFFYLAWERMPLDSICPLYTEVIPLETTGESEQYRVRVLYPEWKPMTVAESKLMSAWDDEVEEDLQLKTHVGRSRGQRYLDVEFVPVVKRDGKYLMLVSAKMEIEPVGASMAPRKGEQQSPAERYARTSRLAAGRWVKIGITDDGIYQLTRTQLKKMGFSNPDNVHLYGHGGHRLSEVSDPSSEFDDLEEVPLYKADDDRWLFWGNGLLYWQGDTRIFNPYANVACYFLTEESQPSHIDEAEQLTASSVLVSSFIDHVLYEKDGFYYFEGGRNLFDSEDFATKSKRTYTLQTPGASMGDERLTVVFTSAAANKVQTTVNGNTLDAFSLSNPASYTHGVSATKNYDVSSFKNGTVWNIQLAATAGVKAHLDYLSLRYRRSIQCNDSYVTFRAEQPMKVTYQLADMTSRHKVMIVGQPGSPASLLPVVQKDGHYEVTVDDGMRRIVCFNPSKTYPEPTSMGTVENQNLHALDSLDMVIIIPANGIMKGQAERLAEAHRAYDGLRVEVIRADQIYNEFSSGTYDATAYRRLMKMLYDRADGDESQMPRYLLLFGDCLWDNRMLSTAGGGKSQSDYLLCFESENSFSDPRSYMMEDYFGLLDDGEGSNVLTEKTDLGVGRFPVVTIDQAKAMVDKHIDFISGANAGEWKNRVMMIGDDGDNNSHMDYCDEVAEQIISRYPQLEVKKVMFDAYQRVSTLTTNSYPEVTALIQQNLKDGVLFANYTGHGSESILSHEKVWGIDRFEETEGRVLPLWLTAACITMPMDGIARNQGEVAVLKPGGGCLAFVGTARTVYASNNWQMNRSFCRYLFDCDSSGKRYRLGDALRMAKVSLAGSEGSNRENKLQYVLAGDPALTMGAPTQHVVIDSLINSIDGEEVSQLKAGMPIRMVGHVEDAEGNLTNQFDGILNTRVYDSMDTIRCMNNAGDARERFVFTERRSLLYAGRDSVRSGGFVVTFVVPKDIKYSGSQGRIVCYAISDSMNVEANGYRQDFTLGGAIEINDTLGPVIDLQVNGQSGGRVNYTPYVTAHLLDESGINFSGMGVGHDILLSVDDRPEWTFVLNDYYQPDFGDYTQGVLGFTLPMLTEGQHTLSLRAWDMMNNTSLAQLDFEVDGSYKPELVTLTNAPNPAATGTTFFVNTDLPGSDVECLIEVFDFAGKRLWKHETRGTSATGQIAVYWNLCVGDGFGKIGKGVYLYRATIRSGESKKVTKSQKLVVNW